jgi:DNA processing protein
VARGGVTDRPPATTGTIGGEPDAPACAACLRRGALVGRLAPGIAGLLAKRGRRPAGLFELSDEDLVRAVRGPSAAAALARFEREFDPKRARERLTNAGLECVCRHSDAYPPALLRLPDAPAALYLAGRPERLDQLLAEPAVTIVGARNATAYALEVAQTLGRGLCAAGVTVVSGLALGVDAAAHRGALRGGDAAIAVLACGADVAYPPSHRDLYERIRSRGVVVSELPPGRPPMRWSFPARNRLMAALGKLTVVVEAAERSGSLITATFAEQVGRDVGAVPGQVTAKRSAGSNRLLRDGAHVIRGPEDVLDELFGVGEDAAVEPSGDGGSPVDATEPPQNGAKPLRANADGGAGQVHRRRELLAAALEAPSEASDLEPRARRVLEAVEAGHGVEAIGAAAGLSAAEVRAALGRLELVGLVARDGLGAYQRTAQGA